MKFENINRDKFVCCADTHSMEKTLYIVRKVGENAVIVHLGDNAEGFQPLDVELRILTKTNHLLEKNDSYLLIIRGNHSKNDAFEEYHLYNQTFSRIYFVPDYSLITINNQKCLFVGGGISIDRCGRIENVSYWSDEEVLLDVDKIQECDILFTHVGGSNEYPQTFNQLVHYWAGEEKKNRQWNQHCLLDELRGEKRKIDKILELSKPKWHLYGHFHCSHFEEIDGIKTRIVNIEEIYNLNQYEK